MSKCPNRGRRTGVLSLLSGLTGFVAQEGAEAGAGGAPSAPNEVRVRNELELHQSGDSR